MIPQNPDFKANILRRLEKQHFMHHIGFNLTKIEAGEVEGELTMKEELKQQFGYLHGGVIATIADLVTGFSAYTLVKPTQGTVTADLKIAYLRPGLGQKIIGRGKVVKAGNLLYFCEADIISVIDGEETLIARGYSTMCAVDVPA